MNKQKQLYVSPETETLVVRFEGVICESDPAKVGGGSFSSDKANVEDDSDEDWGW